MQALSRDNQFAVTARCCLRQRFRMMVELDDGALLIVPVLLLSAANRQHMIEANSDLLPESQHWLQIVFAICCDLTRPTITRLARTFPSTRTRRRREQYMPLVAFCLRHFLADFIICMCEFDFRQAQDLLECVQAKLLLIVESSNDDLPILPHDGGTQPSPASKSPAQHQEIF